jgi:hypothetical protein
MTDGANLRATPGRITVGVALPGEAPPPYTYVCRFGPKGDAWIDSARLADFLFAPLTEPAFDLLMVAGVVAWADRFVRRRVSERWDRDIHLVVPVHDKAFWDRPQVSLALSDALAFITGDRWSFEFTARRSKDQNLKQRPLDFRPDSSVVLPYSDGLDSFATYRLLLATPDPLPLIRVTAKNRIVAASDAIGLGGRSVEDILAPTPVTLRHPRHAEPSFRTRAFLYKTMAMVAADSAGSEHVVVPESGQGSVGPALVPFAGEWPHRGDHPGFTARLSALASAVLGRAVPFHHPHLADTKGSVLRRLLEAGLHAGWQKTKSCVRDQRHSSLDEGRIACGTCTGCLLRRVALAAAGYGPAAERYLFEDLDAPRVAGSLTPRATGRKPRSSDADIANVAVIGMSALSRYAAEASEIDLEFAAFEMGGGASSVAANTIALRAMLDRHRVEWAAFLSARDPGSWMLDAGSA